MRAIRLIVTPGSDSSSRSESATGPLRVPTVIVGAGPADLAVAACLQRARLPFALLERTDRIGDAWHRHYARLHLHTDKARSQLPYLPFPQRVPRYPSRQQVLDYLEACAGHLELRPRFGQEALAATRRDGRWHTHSPDTLYASDCVVLATGYNRLPYLPTWLGQESFKGEVLHSSAYKDGAPYRGQRVLVVGLGNSGGEIAIDLYEHGARPAMAVRSPVTVIPRDLLGLPVLAVSIALRRLPPRLADALTAPIQWAIFGDLAKFGLRQATDGPFGKIRTQAKIPLIDVGTSRSLVILPASTRLGPPWRTRDHRRTPKEQ